jgi:hypothetical protein
MDESLLELETELKSLRPRRPSAQLPGRIERELATAPVDPRYTPATTLRSWKWFGWRPAGVVAALALVATLGIVNFKRPQPAAATSRPVAAEANPERGNAARDSIAHRDHYQPVMAINVLYDMKDEGLVRLDGDIPARRLRYRYLDTYTWKSPRGNASLKWSVPRDEIRVLPASMN